MIKKRIFSLLYVVALTVSFTGCSGCGKEDIKLTAKDASKDLPEIRVFEDGKVTSSLVVDFKEEYYKLDELEKKSKEDIEKFNNANSTKISFDSLEKKDDVVVMVLNFESVDEYVKCDFADSADLKFISGDDAKGNDDVPSDLDVYGKDKKEGKKDAIKSKYKVLIISPREDTAKKDDSSKKEDSDKKEDSEKKDDKEKVDSQNEKKGYEITVDGDIEYTSNVEKVDDNTIKYTNLTEKAIIVFEP